jgi:hypothetical protein
MTKPPNILTPATPAYFNYPAAAQAARLTDKELRALIHIFEADYPDDLMLRELHILRACNAVARGTTTIQQILAPRDTQAA